MKNHQNRQFVFGIDANEANLTAKRVGSNQFAFGLLKALYKIDKKNKYVIYLSSPLKKDLPAARRNWSYRVIPPPKFWTQWRLPLDLYFHQPRPDVFLSLSHYGPRFSPVPNVVTVTDLGFLKFPEQFLTKDLWQLTNWTRYSVRKATHLVAISEFTKKDIIKFYNSPSEKISVVYPSYDEKEFYPINEKRAGETLKKYHLKRPYLFFIGSLKPSKNLERLIEAFSLLENKNLNLVIAGKKAWLYKNIFQKVNELKLDPRFVDLEKRVIFTGFVAEDDVPILMSQAEVFVLPSLYEGFGMPVIEAMACGAPVVVSNTASLPEVAGDAAVIVNPYDVKSIASGIKKAIAQKEFLIKRGFIRAKLFSWRISAEKTVEILEKFSR